MEDFVVGALMLFPGLVLTLILFGLAGIGFYWVWAYIVGPVVKWLMDDGGAKEHQGKLQAIDTGYQQRAEFVDRQTTEAGGTIRRMADDTMERMTAIAEAAKKSNRQP